MDDWVEIFRAGTWTDSQGRTRTWTGADLDRIVQATSAKLGVPGDEAPVVIGHPETDAPAWGWVAAIRSTGERLFVRFRDLVPEFVELVRRQMFPNRSLALNEDYSLRHVGFLGAKPPAVKGLAPITAASGDPLAVITFAKEDRTMWEKLKQFLGLAQELNIPVDGLALPFPAAPAKPDAPKTFTEADLAAAEAKARQETEARLAKESARATRQAAITAFCAELKAKGQLIPAWEAMGLQTFMGQLAESETVIAFAEGKEKSSSLQWFQTFLSELPKVVEFREVTKPGDAPKTTTLSEVQQSVNRQLGVSDELIAKHARN